MKYNHTQLDAQTHLKKTYKGSCLVTVRLLLLLCSVHPIACLLHLNAFCYTDVVSLDIPK